MSEPITQESNLGTLYAHAGQLQYQLAFFSSQLQAVNQAISEHHKQLEQAKAQPTPPPAQ